MAEEDLKLSDRLAIDRTLMAADRTLMAWVRTALSLISFGFTIYKVIQQFQASMTAPVLRPHGPRNLGLLLIGLGTYVVVMGTIQHWSEVRKLGKARAGILKSPGFVLAVAIALLGLFLFTTIVTRMEMF